MSSDRFDLYGLPHRALLAALAAATRAAQHTDYGDQASIVETCDQVRRVFRFLDLHTRVEDEHLNPPGERARLGVAVPNDAEHWDLTLEIGAIEERMRALTLADDPVADGPGLATALEGLTRSLAAHFAAEEAVIAPVLWDSFTDDELKGLQAEILASLAPDDRRLMLEMVEPVLTEAEAAELRRLR